MEDTKKEKIQEILGKYRRAGDISKEAKKLAIKLTKPGALVYDICEEVESYIIKNNAKPAFPVNVSINHEAAHYSAEIMDTRVIPENSVVKVDLGVHIDGYIVDTAITVNHNPNYEKLTQASLDGLNAALETIKAGVRMVKVGQAVERAIKKSGFKPVANLNGHQIKRYVLHAGVSVPNVGPGIFEPDNNRFELGRIYAIEPFASTGKGWIDNGKVTNIFQFIGKPKKKHASLVPIYNEYKSKVGVLPFSPRHLHDKSSGEEGKKEVMSNLRKLIKARLVMGYSVLEERRGVYISQHEDTIRVTKTGVEVFTRDI